MRLLICDPIDEYAVETMRAAGIGVDVEDGITPEGLEVAIGTYDAIVVRSRTKVPASLIDQAPKLRLIIRAGVGLDNIDVAHAHSRGVEVRNTPDASSNAVAELTIAYLFALARSICQSNASLRSGRWEKKRFGTGIELAGKTLGLIGCGRIGHLVAIKAAALGMEVLFYRRTQVAAAGAIQVSLDELLTRSDFISVHVPHTPETHHLLGPNEFARMKEGAFVVNCARGGIIDEAALAQAIMSGRLAGAALDVFADEKEDRGRHLTALPEVIGSPHMGAGTIEAKQRIADEVAEIAIEVHRR
jgi:D-3-phosphoglycerate dehydrogenase